MGWQDEIQPAFWRDIPIEVTAAGIRRGRRTALHEYVGRDDVWVEDLGRGPRYYQIEGYITVTQTGYLTRDDLLDAVEEPGPGILVHPSIGSVFVALIDFSAEEGVEAGGIVRFRGTWIETAAELQSGADSAMDAVGLAADELDGASVLDFLGDVKAATVAARQTVQSVTSTVNTYVGAVNGVYRSAQTALGAVVGIPGSFGRYAGGSRISSIPGVTTVEQALGRANNAASSVDRLAGNVLKLGSLL